MYKPPWLRYYTDTLENLKVQALPGDLFKFWVNTLCVARRHNGALPDARAIAFALHVTTGEVEGNLAALIEANLIDRAADGSLAPHDWREYQFESDSSTPRVRKHRSGNGDETFHATPDETDGNGAGNVPPVVTETVHATPPRNVTVTPQIQSKKREKEADAEREAETRTQPPRERVPASVTAALRADYERFMAAYPSERKGDLAANWFTWQQQAREGALDPIETIVAGLEAHKRSGQWHREKGRYIPRAVKFINERTWTIPPREDDTPKRPRTQAEMNMPDGQRVVL